LFFRNRNGKGVAPLKLKQGQTVSYN
jgi:hypothetical protein